MHISPGFLLHLEVIKFFKFVQSLKILFIDLGLALLKFFSIQPLELDVFGDKMDADWVKLYLLDDFKYFLVISGESSEIFLIFTYLLNYLVKLAL